MRDALLLDKITHQLHLVFHHTAIDKSSHLKFKYAYEDILSRVDRKKEWR
jgi:hypothetical protein